MNFVSDAYNYFNGRIDTEKYIELTGLTSINAETDYVYICKNYTFKNGQSGYMPSSGEAWIFRNLVLEIYDLIEYDFFNFNNTVTSTFKGTYDNYVVWAPLEDYIIESGSTCCYYEDFFCGTYIFTEFPEGCRLVK